MCELLEIAACLLACSVVFCGSQVTGCVQDHPRSGRPWVPGTSHSGYLTGSRDLIGPVWLCNLQRHQPMPWAGRATGSPWRRTH